MSKTADSTPPERKTWTVHVPFHPSFTFGPGVAEDRKYARALAVAMLCALGCEFKVGLLPEDPNREPLSKV